LIWLSAGVLALVAGFGVACLLSVRSTCLAALSMLRDYLSSDLRGEINHLRAQIAAKDEQLLAVSHPTTQAVMAAQKAPQRAYEPGWETAAARPRNPQQFVVSRPGDDQS
jgi:hypothetical protein